MFETLLFYVFGAVLIGAALGVIFSRNPVYSVMFLVLAFFNSAGLWMLAEAEFLAIALVLVYVGAVMVLFLFVVMMLDINIARLREGFIQFLPVGVALALVMFPGVNWWLLATMALILSPTDAALGQAVMLFGRLDLTVVVIVHFGVFLVPQLVGDLLGLGGGELLIGARCSQHRGTWGDGHDSDQ